MTFSKQVTNMRQQGASMPFILLFVAMLAFFFLIGFKLYPVYFEHWQVQSVVTSFENDTEIAELSVGEINKRFRIRLQTNNVREVDFDESIFIEKEEGLLTIYVEYEARVNIYKNIDAVVVFNEETEIFL